MSTIKQIDGYKIYMNEMLGQGSYGAVYIGLSDENKKKVAIKILKKSSIDSDEYLKNALFSEIKIMQAVKSDNIVGFLDVMESSKNYYIVQQLCDGDLSSIVKPGKIIPEQQAKGYLLQICNGFLALVREGIIHRDLKPANIMRKGNQLKLGDFGFAKKTQGTSVKNQTIVGTPLYMSLQILKSEPYSSKCDIWALGFIYYEMLHGYTPWMGKSEFDLIKKIQSKELKVDANLSQQSIDFLQKCLGKEENERISWDQLFVHPIFNGYFLQHSHGNKQFENKLKMVMSDLRFEINSQNLDLFKILSGLGYKSGQVQLDQDRFYQFLKIVSPSLTRKQSDYIFNKTDLDKNGSISIQEIQMIMNAHNISLTSINHHIPGVNRQESNSMNEENSGFIMTQTSQKKIRHCFNKLFQILQNQNRILYDVFVKFDKQKSGSLDRMQFRRMLKQLSQEIDNDEIDAAFDLIDEDRSNSIQFIELNTYFSKVNGIPEHLNRPSDPTMGVQKPNNFFQHLLMQNTNHQNQGQFGGGNFFQQPPMYHGPPPPQPMYGGFQQQQFQYNPYQNNPYQQQNQYYPQQQQQQQQQQGLLSNPIFNKLSQNMHGSQGSQHQNPPNNQKGWGNGW